MNTEEFRQQYGYGLIEKYINDKGNHQLQTGIDPTQLGLDFSQKGLSKNFLSPFTENSKQPDPLNSQHFHYKVTNLQQKKECFQKFPEETHFYIFYNQLDEQQQMWAVECLYSKGWRYNFNNETWFKDIVHQGGNIYNCKVFNIEKWAIVDLPSASFDMENDFCTMEDFEESIRP